MIHSDISPAETLGALHRAGGQLRAAPDGQLFVDGLAPTDLNPAMLASLKRYKPILHRFVVAFPGGCWPCKVVPMD